MTGTSLLAFLASVGAGLLSIQSDACAQPPNLSVVYWNSPLAFNVCIQQASAALRDLGFTDLQTIKTAVNGHYGDFTVQVFCLTAKGTVMIIDA